MLSKTAGLLNVDPINQLLLNWGFTLSSIWLSSLALKSFLLPGMSALLISISFLKTKGLYGLYFFTTVHEETRSKIKKKYKKKEGRIFVGKTDINCNKVLSKSRVKYIQSLFHKKFRNLEGRFIIEGPKIINEFLLKTPEAICEIYATAEWLKNNNILPSSLAQEKITIITADDLHKISSLPTPNQVLAIVQKPETAFPDISAHENIIMLDEIQDPGNMGTIIRIADWFGITKIICSISCADMYNSKVIQSTMGSILRVHVLYTDLVEWCKKHSHIPVYAATLHGRSLYETTAFEHGVILMGNESKGIKPELLALSTSQITIPRIGAAESLNAAVATGIILSHFTQKTFSGHH